ncbi:diguanylate cyclase [Angustibacter sp. McL0619]|uniref:GGDEF domain-containing protein n=1 Tax=Angustibacter sp. McL0619 TaxID=3415676 RepID=UPI003CF7C116
MLRRRIQLVKANADSRYGDVAASAVTMRSIRDWAAEHGETYLQSRAERWLANLLRRAGESSGSLEAAVACVRLLPNDAPAAILADHLSALADALAISGAMTESLARYREAVEVVETSDNVDLQLLVLNNYAYTLFEADLTDQAVATCERILAVNEAHGLTPSLHVVDTIANVYLSVGRDDEALALLAPDHVPADAPGEDVGELALTRARALRERGDLVGSEAELDRCSAVSQAHDLFSLRVRTLQERAELHAARGDFEAAFTWHKEFHSRQLELHVEQREARAKMMHALFETDEARRESAHFRELSYRDGLTRLYNRRYVDEHLTPLLDRATGDGHSVSVAFIDLDHFKAVNDTYTHEVGDTVLRRLAAVLDRSTVGTEGAFAARMGGEEFLVVLPGLEPDCAREHVDRLRQQVAAQDWSRVAEGLRVTVSAGVATSGRDGLDRLALLARADSRLYKAKRLGRDRVVAS